MHQLSQIGEAIDVFSQGCEFELLAPIAVFHEAVVFGLEIGLAAEDDIGGESQAQGRGLLGAPRMQLHLHEAPVITSTKLIQDRTEALRPSVQTPMQAFGIEAIG
ncbi:MAG: hypothetical protein ACREXS_07130, partial [Gammaproteobacteria bacterium]